MSIPAIDSKVHASELPLDRLASTENVSEKEKLAEVARQFEAMLLRKILTEARKPLLGSALQSSSAISQIYGDMVNTQLADAMSRSGGLGLGHSFQAQLTRQSNTVQSSLSEAAAQPAPSSPFKKPYD